MFDETDVTDLAGMTRLFQRTFGMKRAEEALSHYLNLPGDEEAEWSSHPPGSEEAVVDRALGQLGADLWYGGGSWHMANLVASSAAAPPVFLYTFAEKVYAGPNSPPSAYHGADLRFWHGSRLDNNPEHSHPDPAATQLGTACCVLLASAT